MPWAIAAGALFGWSGLTMPVRVGKTIALLSDAASPAALFTIGAILARNAVRATHSSPPMDYVPIALAKLFVHPLAIFVAARAAQVMGYAFTAQTLTALMLVAALPSASNVSMLAERFGVDSERIAWQVRAGAKTRQTAARRGVRLVPLFGKVAASGSSTGHRRRGKFSGGLRCCPVRSRQLTEATRVKILPHVA